MFTTSQSSGAHSQNTVAKGLFLVPRLTNIVPGLCGGKTHVPHTSLPQFSTNTNISQLYLLPLSTCCPTASEAIHNVYKLPLIESAVRYLHIATSFPTKATCLKSNRCGKYLTWHLITVKYVHKYSTESEETLKGHMQHQRQVIRSTKQQHTLLCAPMYPTVATLTLARGHSVSNGDSQLLHVIDPVLLAPAVINFEK